MFIKNYTKEEGFPPTYAEIGKAVGLTAKSAVSYRLDRLAERGYVERKVGSPRTVRVTGRWKNPAD